jgi:hypothetical protein
MAGNSAKTYFQNGGIKIESSDGMVYIIDKGIKWTTFLNGDQLQEFPDGATAYRYAATGAIELKLAGGKSIVEFPDGQREYWSGTGEVKVSFPDGRRAMGWMSHSCREMTT